MCLVRKRVTESMHDHWRLSTGCLTLQPPAGPGCSPSAPVHASVSDRARAQARTPRPPACAGPPHAPRRPARRPSGGSGPPLRRPRSPSALPGAVPPTLLRIVRVALTGRALRGGLPSGGSTPRRRRTRSVSALPGTARAWPSRTRTPQSAFQTSRVKQLARRHRPTCCAGRTAPAASSAPFRRRAALRRPRRAAAPGAQVQRERVRRAAARRPGHRLERAPADDGRPDALPPRRDRRAGRGPEVQPWPGVAQS